MYIHVCIVGCENAVVFSTVGRQLQSSFGGRMQQGMRGNLPAFGGCS